MRRFFAALQDFHGDTIELNPDESRHLRDVLRSRVGESVAAFDGEGGEYLCTIEKVGRKHENARLHVLEKTEPQSPESHLDLRLAVGLLKGEKFDLVIQKAVELGAKRILPLETRRADVKIVDARDAAKKLERWRRIALEAAKQSGRATLSVIETPVAFEDFAKQTADGEPRILFTERAGEELNLSLTERFDRVTAIIGAEGGWTDDELKTARANDLRLVTFGGRILRAETAAIAAATLLQHLWGDLR